MQPTRSSECSGELHVIYLFFSGAAQPAGSQFLQQGSKPGLGQWKQCGVLTTGCCCSAIKSCLALHSRGLPHARLPSPSLSPQSLLRLTSTESVMLSDHLNVSHLLPPLPSTSPTETGGEGAGHNFWKNDIVQGTTWIDQKQMGPRGQTSQLDQTSILRTSSHQQAKWHTHRRHGSSEVSHQSGHWLKPWESLPLPQNSWNSPPTH